MATANEAMASGSHTPEAEPADQVQRKRKASLVDTTEEGSPKRSRQEDDARDPGRPRRPSPHRNRRESIGGLNYDEASRQKSASVEEKKRGKRLFGGLLNTLSQTNTSSHQRRRQEIEKRQQERLQKQKAEDDQKNEEKLAQLQELRMGRQLEFEKEVMQQKHSRLLWQSRHLKTKAEPVIYYSPWKLTGDQENAIDEQVSVAQSLIEAELEAFKDKERVHAERYGSQPSPRAEHSESREAQDADAEPSSSEVKMETKDGEAKPGAGAEGAGTTVNVATVVPDHHDDSEDVVVEGDEDMVIY